MATSTAWAATSGGAGIVQAGIPDRGVPACASCHGADGRGVAAQNAPRLAGLNATYLARQLEAFASGARPDPVMSPIAQHLTLEQSNVVAAYFAGLPPVADIEAVDPTILARGKALAERGAWSVQAPPCAACHGPAGTGVGATTPPLAGQRQAYLLRQLLQFRAGARKGDALGTMTGIAERLPEADLRAAAAYYASLPLPGAAR